MNTEAHCSNPLGMDPKEEIILKIRDEIPTKPIEVNTQSTSTAQEQPVLFDSTDQHETT